MADPTQGGVSENTTFGFYYAIYYAILFFTTLFTTLREAPANDLYVFWHVPKRQYGTAPRYFLRFPAPKFIPHFREQLATFGDKKRWDLSQAPRNDWVPELRSFGK